ncbi:MAG: hypothetical protein IJ801_01410, partial [Lachnospiraceae bacterium]|nr:hypothetical protein [Lachnospiraceae bacterium]
MSIHVRTNKEFYKNPVSLTQSSIQSPTAGSTSTQRLSHTDTLRAVKDGTLTVDGITLELSDEVRGAIQKASDQAFADNEATGMLNAAIHNANVARQQSESCEKALDNEQKALE